MFKKGRGCEYGEYDDGFDVDFFFVVLCVVFYLGFIIIVELMVVMG